MAVCGDTLFSLDLITYRSKIVFQDNPIVRDPFGSDEVRLFFYGEPVASDDGLFRHRDEYVPCFGCQGEQ